MSRGVTLRGEDGFTLMELLVAMTLLLAVSAPFSGMLVSSIAAQRLSRERTIAQQAALTQIEAVRALPYDQIGLVDGNPPGVVMPVRLVAGNGVQATVRTAISYVGDPTRTGYATGTDYKRVLVTITRNRDGKVLTREATYVSPTARDPYGGINQTRIDAQVIDVGSNTPLPDAVVTLGTGPSATRTDRTDTAGRVSFPGLTANPSSGPQMFYDVTAALGGYLTLPDDLPPSGAAHVQLAPGQTFSTVLRMYRAATILVQLQSATGAAFTGPASVVVASPRAAQTFTVSGGGLTVTSLDGEPLVPGLVYTVAASTPGGLFTAAAQATVPSDYPTTLTSTFAPRFGSTPLPTAALTVQVTTPTGAVAAGARVDVSGGPASTLLTATADAAGTARLSVPAGGPYTVVARGPGAPTVTWSGSVPGTTTVSLREA